MNRLGRQISKPFQRFGRQLSGEANKFGRQASGAFKMLPQAYKDTSKAYSDIEKKTKGIPVVSDIFGGAAKATDAIGQAMGGNVGPAFSGIKGGSKQGLKAFGDALKTAGTAALFL